MPQTRILIGLLLGLCVIGTLTIQLMSTSDASMIRLIAWGLYLVFTPLALAGLVWMGWSWTAMACVMYGTIGLALDLATIAGILGGNNQAADLLALSAASGLCNFLLIFFGGRAFVQALQGPRPPGSRPPNPPSPSSA